MTGEETIVLHEDGMWTLVTPPSSTNTCDDARVGIAARGLVRAPAPPMLINPGIKGNLHDQAWGIADAVVSRMRAATSGKTIP